MISFLVALLLFTFVASSAHAFEAVGYYSSRLDARQPVFTRAAAGIVQSNCGRLERHLSFFRTVEVQSRLSHPNERRSGFNTGTTLLLFNSDTSFVENMLITMNENILTMCEDMGQIKATSFNTSKSIDVMNKSINDMSKSIRSLEATSASTSKSVANLETSFASMSKSVANLETTYAVMNKTLDGMNKNITNLVRHSKRQATVSQERDDGLVKDINLEKVFKSRYFQRRESAAQMSMKSSTVDNALSEGDKTPTMSEDTNINAEKKAGRLDWKKIFTPFAALITFLVNALRSRLERFK